MMLLDSSMVLSANLCGVRRTDTMIVLVMEQDLMTVRNLGSWREMMDQMTES